MFSWGNKKNINTFWLKKSALSDALNYNSVFIVGRAKIQCRPGQVQQSKSVLFGLTCFPKS